jgi:hypothetical protein
VEAELLRDDAWLVEEINMNDLELVAVLVCEGDYEEAGWMFQRS